MKIRNVPAAAALAAAAVLAGCGSDAAPAADPAGSTSSSPSASSEATPSASPTASAEVATGEVTAEGSELAIGEPATIPYASGSANLAFATFNGIDGLLADGSTAAPLYVIGDFEPCDSASFPKDFGPGKTVQTCEVFLTSGDAEVSQARWTSMGSGPYSDRETGILWK